MKTQDKRLNHLNNLAKLIGKTTLETRCLMPVIYTAEFTGYKLALSYCNGVIDHDSLDFELKKMKASLKNIFPAEVFENLIFNTDPRGYFLKLNDDFVRKNKVQIETDWGGFGILCPEGTAFNES